MKNRSLRKGLWLLVCLSAGCGFLIGSGLGGKKDGGTNRRLAGVFRGAPVSASKLQNPYSGQTQAVLAGRKLFLRHCAQCHGENAEGRWNAPPLSSGVVNETPDGVLFWFLKKGNLRAGMPSWSGLPAQQRWQIVSFLKSLR
jgi:mono/diheme cytochrome c family protein